MGCGASTKRISPAEALSRFDDSLKQGDVDLVFRDTLLLIETNATADDESRKAAALLLMQAVLDHHNNDLKEMIKAAKFHSDDKMLYMKELKTSNVLVGKHAQDLQPILDDPLASEIVATEAINLFSGSVEQGDVKETLRSTEILQRLTLEKPLSAGVNQEAAALLLMKNAFSEEYRGQEKPLAEAAQFHNADKDMYGAKLDMTSLEDTRIKQLLSVPVPIVSSIILPEISRRLSTAVEQNDVSKVLWSTDCLKEKEPAAALKQEAAAVLLVKAALSGSHDGQEAVLVEAAKFHSEDENMYRAADLDTSSIEDARVAQLVGIPLLSAILVPEISRRLSAAVEQNDADGTLMQVQLFQKVNAPFEEDIKKAAAIVLLKQGLEGAESGDQFVGVALSLCNDKLVYSEAMPEHQARIEELLSSVWQISPSGDSVAGDWIDLPAEISAAFEQFFMKYKETGEARVSATVDDTIYRLDLEFMTVLATTQDRTDMVKPMRKINHAGEQVYPDPGGRHPWYHRRIEIQEAKGGDGDWLTNEFFFDAFCESMRSSGHKVVSEADEIFDFRFNQDFRAFTKDQKSEVFTRGGEKYSVPVGWKRFAVRVKGKYDGGDDSWLGLDGAPGEWAVAYHGTKKNCLPGILENGFFAGSRQVFATEKAIGGGVMGSGVYCSPNIDDVAAHENYATPGSSQGHTAQFVMQCRVRPGAIKKIDRQGNSGLGTPWNEIWVLNDPKDIRPYAILVRGGKSEFRPATVGHFTNELTF